LQYRTLITHLFRYPNWAKPVLVLGLLYVIPIAGLILAHGWWVRLMHRRLRGDEAELPELDDLMAIATDGVLPFVAFVIASFMVLFIMYPLMMMFQLFMGILVLGTSAFAVPLGGKLLPPAIVFAVSIGGIGLLLLWVLIASVQVLVAACVLRVEISGRLEDMFALKELFAETKSMYLDLLIGTLAVMVMSVPMIMIGYALCFVGVIPAMFIMQTAMVEVRTRAYRRYVQRGGTPIATVSHLDGGTLPPG
jgi:hypothetical protein